MAVRFLACVDDPKRCRRGGKEESDLVRPPERSFGPKAEAGSRAFSRVACTTCVGVFVEAMLCVCASDAGCGGLRGSLAWPPKCSPG